MKRYIHHTVFTNFTYINKKNSAHQSQNNITTLTEVDNLHILQPSSLHHSIMTKLPHNYLKQI